MEVGVYLLLSLSKGNREQVNKKERSRGSMFMFTNLSRDPRSMGTHHRVRPAGAAGEQPVETDDAVGLRGGTDVDHGLGGRHRVERGGPETFWGCGLCSTPGPATGGFTCGIHRPDLEREIRKASQGPDDPRLEGRWQLKATERRRATRTLTMRLCHRPEGGSVPPRCFAFAHVNPERADEQPRFRKAPG